MSRQFQPAVEVLQAVLGQRRRSSGPFPFIHWANSVLIRVMARSFNCIGGDIKIWHELHAMMSLFFIFIHSWLPTMEDVQQIVYVPRTGKMQMKWWMTREVTMNAAFFRLAFMNFCFLNLPSRVCFEMPFRIELFLLLGEVTIQMRSE